MHEYVHGESSCMNPLSLVVVVQLARGVWQASDVRSTQVNNI